MQKRIKKGVSKLKNIRKRYYILFTLLIVFSAYNIMTLRGFYYTENYNGGVFAFMDKGYGYTDVDGWTYDENELLRSSACLPPGTIQDIDRANHRYFSILGTIVTMHGKWIGLHVGKYMILVDTWVPDGFAHKNYILGHPYYILRRYDTINYFGTEKEQSHMERKWEKMRKINGPDYDNMQRWLKKQNMYRRNTVIVYVVFTIGIAINAIRAIRRRKRKHITKTTS